mmetsp:Transcript_21267/g.54254  ORF Transcript_21267/g.54254 Transcript_21267/m.54254 type:complete len:338 (-) Transcript_21267:1193-2206(-)
MVAGGGCRPKDGECSLPQATELVLKGCEDGEDVRGCKPKVGECSLPQGTELVLRGGEVEDVRGCCFLSQCHLCSVGDLLPWLCCQSCWGRWEHTRWPDSKSATRRAARMKRFSQRVSLTHRGWSSSMGCIHPDRPLAQAVGGKAGPPAASPAASVTGCVPLRPATAQILQRRLSCRRSRNSSGPTSSSKCAKVGKASTTGSFARVLAVSRPGSIAPTPPGGAAPLLQAAWDIGGVAASSADSAGLPRGLYPTVPCVRCGALGADDAAAPCMDKSCINSCTLLAWYDAKRAALDAVELHEAVLTSQRFKAAASDTEPRELHEEALASRRYHSVVASGS